MPESNQGSWWWRNWIGKKRDSSCKISNEAVDGIEISFREEDIKYLEFLFLYYMDDSICKDHDWKLFDCLSPSKRRNIINLNLEFKILVKDWICYLMFAFHENMPIESGPLAQIKALRVPYKFPFNTISFKFIKISLTDS
ncbi:hypothetical protein PVK06_026125 [Gossypium arboreum]|uniref:Ycf2 N-terminal domain-containing protein n=1 Tax=Gossypium arboreum TaxID=29729 RepID=A0ABR0NWU1_GOSAR|nr:hypothetical protein PVK06_026125 [Gossypium arboreum]